MEPIPAIDAGALALEGLTKEFALPGGGPVRAVDGVTLAVAPGEFLTLLGPSGCGKTTTLRLLAGFESPTAGRIRLDGQDITEAPPHLRQMAMVFQSYALFPHLTVFENVAYGLRLKHLREAEIAERVEMVLHLMNLVGKASRSPYQLSGGEQQRVALARALVLRPKVLLFDEPLSNLDAKLRVQMRAELRRLQVRLGITAVYVTHDQAEAMSLADRIVVMRDGRVEQVGAPHEVYRRPASVFVADFIGRANFIEARVESVEDGRACVRLHGRPLTLPSPDGVAAGDEVYVVIRPEACAVGLEGWVRGEVSQVTYLGSQVEYEVEAGDHALLVVEYAPERVFAEGAQVGVELHTDRACLLPCARPAPGPGAVRG